MSTADVTFNDRTHEALVQMDGVHDKETRRIARLMKDMAKEVVPVDTTRLQKSIEMDGSNNAYRVFTQTAHDGKPGYGYWQEVGTAIMEAQPFLRPALQRAAEIVLKGASGLGWIASLKGRGARTRKATALGARGFKP